MKNQNQLKQKILISRIKLFLGVVMISASILSCDNEKAYAFQCDQNQLKEVKSFVSENIKASNNMSDEEMEDVIIELKKTGVRLTCTQVYVEYESICRVAEKHHKIGKTLFPCH